MNAEQQKAVERLAELANAKTATQSGHVLSNDLKALLPLITELEADRKRLEALESAITDMKAPAEIKAFTKREYWKAGARAVIEKINAAMKGA